MLFWETLVVSFRFRCLRHCHWTQVSGILDFCMPTETWLNPGGGINLPILIISNSLGFQVVLEDWLWFTEIILNVPYTIIILYCYSGIVWSFSFYYASRW